MSGWWWYAGPGILTQMLAPLWTHRREGTPWREAWMLLMVWPLGLMWPVMLTGMLADIVDGPHEPRHRAVTW